MQMITVTLNTMSRSMTNGREVDYSTRTWTINMTYAVDSGVSSMTQGEAEGASQEWCSMEAAKGIAKGWPMKRPRGKPRGRQWEAKGRPRSIQGEAKGRPRGSQGEANGEAKAEAKGRPRSIQGEPKGRPRGGQGEAKGKPR